jgi:flagellar assembly factor FliW
MTQVSELRALPALDLRLPAGLPGMADLQSVRLEPLGARQNVFGRLVAPGAVRLADRLVEGLSLIVAAPGLLWPDYTVEVDDETARLLQLAEPADAAALVVVSVGDRLEDCTANLYAPIVLNVRERLAAQLVPARPESELGWPLRAPLPLAAAA